MLILDTSICLISSHRKIGLILIDLTQILSIKNQNWKYPSLSKVMINKTVENCRNYFDAEEHIVSNLSKIAIPNLYSRNFRLESRMCQNVTSLLSKEEADRRSDFFLRKRFGRAGPICYFKRFIWS